MVACNSHIYCTAHAHNCNIYSDSNILCEFAESANRSLCACIGWILFYIIFFLSSFGPFNVLVSLAQTTNAYDLTFCCCMLFRHSAWTVKSNRLHSLSAHSVHCDRSGIIFFLLVNFVYGCWWIRVFESKADSNRSQNVMLFPFFFSKWLCLVLWNMQTDFECLTAYVQAAKLKQHCLMKATIADRFLFIFIADVECWESIAADHSASGQRTNRNAHKFARRY